MYLVNKKSKRIYIKHVLWLQIAQQYQIVHKQNLKQTTCTL